MLVGRRVFITMPLLLRSGDITYNLLLWTLFSWCCVRCLHVYELLSSPKWTYSFGSWTKLWFTMDFQKSLDNRKGRRGREVDESYLYLNRKCLVLCAFIVLRAFTCFYTITFILIFWFSKTKENFSNMFYFHFFQLFLWLFVLLLMSPASHTEACGNFSENQKDLRTNFYNSWFIRRILWSF